VFPSGPSCIVMPCISDGWKYCPSSEGALQPCGSVLLGWGAELVYREPVAPQMSPWYGLMSVAGDTSRISANACSYSAEQFVPFGLETGFGGGSEAPPSNQKRFTGP
jgi:hypothetical protein